MKHLKTRTLLMKWSQAFNSNCFQIWVVFFVLNWNIQNGRSKENFINWIWNNWSDCSVCIIFPPHFLLTYSYEFFFVCVGCCCFSYSKLERSVFQNIRTNSKGSLWRGGRGRGNWVSFIDVWSWGMFLPAFSPSASSFSSCPSSASSFFPHLSHSERERDWGELFPLSRNDHSLERKKNSFNNYHI